MISIDALLARTRRTPNGCRIWLGARTTDGYGHVRTGPSSWDYTHRLVWQARHGRIPADRIIDHRCRRRACLELRHLRLVTYSENNLAGWITKRAQRLASSSGVGTTSSGTVRPAPPAGRSLQAPTPGPRLEEEAVR